MSPNATKHINEYIAAKTVKATPEAVRLMTQQQLRGLQSAVDSATKNGVVYDKLIRIDNWELVFRAPRKAGGLPALIHALPKVKK